MPFQIEPSQLTMLAGMLLMGWMLMRHQLRSRAQLRATDREDQAIMRQQALNDQRSAVPLRDAPADAQRWLVEMHDLQRELKAELDTKIVVVQQLLRQADERIATLKREQASAAQSPTSRS